MRIVNNTFLPHPFRAPHRRGWISRNVWISSLCFLTVFASLVPRIVAGETNRSASTESPTPDSQHELAVRQNGLSVTHLRCEHMIDPLGIDAANPRLSWELQSTARNVMQSAFQILVASERELLATDQTDLWDSGKVVSSQSIHIPYAGAALTSHTKCYWKVRVWDQAGHSSAWSQPAFWSMGILDPTEWQASWLSYVKPLGRKVPKGHPAEQLKLGDASWIWTRPASVQAGSLHFFRRVFSLPSDTYVQWAYVSVAATQPYRLFVNGLQTSKSASTTQPWKRAYEVELTSRLRPGSNILAFDIPQAAAEPGGLAATIVVQLSNGKRIILVTDDQWRTSTKGGKEWFKGSFDDKLWSPATIVGPVGQGQWGKPQPGPRVGWSQVASSPLMRKSFRVDKPILRATAYICGLGYHELHINGKKVGNHVLDPAFTRYDRRMLYVTHDVTEQLKQGENAIGVMLGNGWYNMFTRATWDFDMAPWRKSPTLLVHLRIELADGTVKTIVSNRSWRASTGPIVLDSIRAGEVYDSRLQQPGWDSPGFDDSHWQPAQEVAAPRGQLSPQVMPPIRVTETIKPVTFKEPRPGVFVLDMGQNIAGWVRLKVQGPAGTRITLRYSERVDDQGMIERSEIEKFVFEGPFQTDVYILNGSGVEQWQPRFTYHGFRYVEVTGLPAAPARDTLTGCVVHTAFYPIGHFRCSNRMFNAVQRLTRWSYRNNYHGYPTDCPTREKNGWTGDAHLAAEQAMFNFNNTAAYHKWIQDIHDEQHQSGEIAAIIPTSGWGYAWGNGPAWDSAFLLIPWYLYVYQGDTAILEKHFDGMKRYVDYLTSRSKNHIVHIGLGDWAPAKTKTPNSITSTAYYYVDAGIVADAAKILGKPEEAKKYRNLAAAIRKAFNNQFYQGNGIYLNGSQTALSCAIYQGLVQPEEKEKVLDQLVANIKKTNGHLDVGILGAKYLLHALSENGRHQWAYQVASQTSAPSYGDWVARGATTLWENWDGESSLNHIMYGDISAWFYQQLAGIHADPAEPGFKHFVIRPRSVDDLRWVDAQTQSMHGMIRSSWTKANDMFQMKVLVPANTRATLFIPASAGSLIRESGIPVDRVPGITSLGIESGYAGFQLGSGEYRFIVQSVRANSEGK